MPIDLDKYPLDEQMQAFLSDCASHFPETKNALDVDSNRSNYLSLCEAYNYPLPGGVLASDHGFSADGRHIPARIYRPALSADESASPTRVIYYHGGGFVVGNLDSHHSICADLAADSRCEVIAVDYRLSPENTHPAAFDDALAAFDEYDNGRTIVCGDSAGGTLAAAVCTATRQRQNKPLGQVLIYPWLGGELFDLESYRVNADAPGLTRRELDNYNTMRTDNGQAMQDHTYYPLALDDFRGMPPCVSFAAEFDPLRDDSGEYVSRLAVAGVDAKNHIESGLTHGYLRARRVSHKAGASFEKIGFAIRSLADRF